VLRIAIDVAIRWTERDRGGDFPFLAFDKLPAFDQADRSLTPC